MFDLDHEAVELANALETPYWVRDVIHVALKKDPVDALHAFSKLAEVFERRNDELARLNSQAIQMKALREGAIDLAKETDGIDLYLGREDGGWNKIG